MNKYFSWFLFILSIASLWMALVILTSASFSTQDMGETIFNFIGLCFFSLLFEPLATLCSNGNRR